MWDYTALCISSATNTLCPCSGQDVCPTHNKRSKPAAVAFLPESPSWKVLPALTPGVLFFPSGAWEQVALLLQVALTQVILVTGRRGFKLLQAGYAEVFSVLVARVFVLVLLYSREATLAGWWIWKHSIPMGSWGCGTAAPWPVEVGKWLWVAIFSYPFSGGGRRAPRDRLLAHTFLACSSWKVVNGMGSVQVGLLFLSGPSCCPLCGGSLAVWHSRLTCGHPIPALRVSTPQEGGNSGLCV